MEKKYSKDHIKVIFDNDIVTINLSEYALNKLNTIVFVNLPDEGEKIEFGNVFGDVESIKTVSDLIAPINGSVIEVNEELLDVPESLTPTSWLIKVSDFSIEEELMTESQYKEYVESL